MESAANIVSFWAKSNSWELSFETGTFVDDFVVFSDTDVTPMRDFNNLFDVGELHLSVVVDSEDRVFDMGVRFKTIFIELDLGGSFLDTIRIILTTYFYAYWIFANLYTLSC